MTGSKAGKRGGVRSGKVHKPGFDLGMPRAVSCHFYALHRGVV